MLRRVAAALPLAVLVAALSANTVVADTWHGSLGEAGSVAELSICEGSMELEDEFSAPYPSESGPQFPNGATLRRTVEVIQPPNGQLDIGISNDTMILPGDWEGWTEGPGGYPDWWPPYEELWHWGWMLSGYHQGVGTGSVTWRLVVNDDPPLEMAYTFELTVTEPCRERGLPPARPTLSPLPALPVTPPITATADPVVPSAWSPLPPPLLVAAVAATVSLGLRLGARRALRDPSQRVRDPSGPR